MEKTLTHIGATDMEIAIFLTHHIENPCGVKVNGKWEHIRGFYIERAKEALPKLTNPFAIEHLNLMIAKYDL